MQVAGAGAVQSGNPVSATLRGCFIVPRLIPCVGIKRCASAAARRHWLLCRFDSLPRLTALRTRPHPNPPPQAEEGAMHWVLGVGALLATIVGWELTCKLVAVG